MCILAVSSSVKSNQPAARSEHGSTVDTGSARDTLSLHTRAHCRGGLHAEAVLWVHAGEWAQDLQEGLGTCQYMDGTEYRGRWKGGLRHGRGVFIRPGGYAYDGDWAEDCPHGTGSCRLEDGTRHSHRAQPSNSCPDLL